MLHQFNFPAARPGAVRVIFLAALQCAFISPAIPQFTDDFSDGIFAPWAGDTTHFIINAGGELQLNAPSGSATSWLHVPVVYADSMVWEFKVRMDFAPSASNQLRIFLGLTSPVISASNGYVLEIGATGDQDALVFYHLNQGMLTYIGSSAPGLVAADPVNLTLRVTAFPTGSWVIERLGTGLPEVLFNASHTLTPLITLHHFGLLCRYTETRRDRFRFDDIRIEPWRPDTDPPRWIGLHVASDRSITLYFDEPLDSLVASNTLHFLLLPFTSFPSIVEVDGAIITLTWPDAFVSGQPYALTVEGIADMGGNIMDTTTLSFVWTRVDTAGAHNLLITEIMADPSPPIGLPEAEYLEIYNAGPGTYRLSDYSLVIGSARRTLPDSLLRPGEFVIVCDQTDAHRFARYGRIAPVASLPALPNTGAGVMLVTPTDVVLHAVPYTAGWYGDGAKDDGGWSLEMRNPLAVCAGPENWSASDNLLGGTPGTANSDWRPEPDTNGPSLVSLHMDGPYDLILTFDESLDDVLMVEAARYVIHPELPISKASLAGDQTVSIRFAVSPDTGAIYWLVDYPAFDCLGNPGERGEDRPFGLPATPKPGDLLINEVLFNPAVGGSRFIELVNTTSRFVDLGGLAAGRIGASTTQLMPIGVQASLAPGALVVFSPDTADILRRYHVPRPDLLFPANLPAWDDDMDNVTILANGMVLDSFTYSSAWHHPLLRDVNGVSLERISPDAPTSVADTWHSAAGAAGYATPTGENSQKLSGLPVVEKPFTLTHTVFSPDGDGEKDYLSIRFDTETRDLVCTVLIHDLESREIASPAENVLLGAHSLVQWNGRRTDGSMADMGFYVIFIRLWTPDGHVSTYTETCALVER